MPFTFVTYGRYISVDGQWLILRVRPMGLCTKKWDIYTWDAETRTFKRFDHRGFRTLNDAKRFVTAKTELAVFGDL